VCKGGGEEGEGKRGGKQQRERNEEEKSAIKKDKDEATCTSSCLVLFSPLSSQLFFLLPFLFQFERFRVSHRRVEGKRHTDTRTHKHTRKKKGDQKVLLVVAPVVNSDTKTNKHAEENKNPQRSHTKKMRSNNRKQSQTEKKRTSC
jgi:hypothetical protein